MKFTSALTTLVSLSTLANALPNQQYGKRQFNNGTGAAVAAGNTAATNATLAPTTNGTAATNGTTVPGSGGNGVAAVNTGSPVTQTVVQTITSTVSQQYSTYLTTKEVTATIVFSAGAGIGSVATAVPVGSSPAGSTSGSGTSPVVVSVGSAQVAPGSSSGSGSGSSPAVAAAGVAGSAGSVGATGTSSGSTCACAAAPVVVATGIYTVTVKNIINLGTTTYTTSYPTTTLGVISISAGSIVAAVPTVTNSAVIATNTAAPLSAGQSYQTVTVPASGSTAAYEIVVIVSVVTSVTTPVVANNGGNNVGAVGLSTSSVRFSNSSSTIASSGASAKPQVATVSSLTALPSSSASSTGAAGAQVAAAQTASSGQAAQATSALAAASSSAATTTSAAAATSTALAPNTQAAVIGSQGTTPLVDQDGFVNAILAAHNMYRARHGAPAMTYSSTLAQTALANVNANAAAGTFKHTVDMGISDPYGENLGEQYGANNPEYLVYLWYDEITSYNYSSPGFSESTGHFTQVVWDASTELGCAYIQTTDANNDYLLACEYNSPGNVDGQYATQVNAVVAGAAAYSAPAANAS